MNQRKKIREQAAISVLHRLKRRFGRERSRLDKWEKEARKEGRIQHADRCYYEATQWSVAMGMLDEEIMKAKGEG